MAQKAVVDLFLLTRSYVVRKKYWSHSFFLRFMDDAEVVFYRRRGQYSQIRTEEANILNKVCLIMALFNYANK